MPDTIDIYISYTRRAPEDEKIAKAFYAACEAHSQLRPHIDTEDLRLGDGIYQYMDKLSAARFVVCVFSEDYFKSENCVLEFAGLCHNGYLQERVFPLFVKHFFNDDMREVMMMALADDPNLQRRVKEKTGCLLKDILEQARRKPMDELAGKVHDLADVDLADDFKNFIHSFLVRIEQHNKNRLEKHKNRLIEQIDRKLNHRDLKESLPELGYELECDKTSKECSRKLLEIDVRKAIHYLIKVAEEVGLSTEKNRRFQEVVGLLLVSAIEPSWWLVNEFRLQHKMNNGVGLPLGKLSNHVIEIVIARFFDRPARHRVGPKGVILSQNHLESERIIPFTDNSTAMKESYIREFYHQITRTDLGSMKVDKEHMIELRGRLKNRLRDAGRQYFYLITRDNYTELDRIGAIQAINKDLESLVQFIVVGERLTGEDDANVLSVDSDEICGYLSTILKPS